MEITKDKLLETLDDIHNLIIDSEKTDGCLKKDMKMSMVDLSHSSKFDLIIEYFIKKETTIFLKLTKHFSLSTKIY